MFTYAIRNIVHKQTSKETNILYYPANDIIDDIITDIDANFYVPQESMIRKNNVCILSNIALFEYDFILTHELNNSIIDLSTKLHIPIIVYLKYASYDDSRIPDHKNVYYIVEHHGESDQDKLISVIPQINRNTTNNGESVCLFINNQNDFGNIVQTLHSKISNLSIADETKINQDAMIEIISKHKVCIDLYPKSISKMLFCARHNIPYVTIPNVLTQKYKEIYDGLFFMETELAVLLDLIKRLSSSSISYNLKIPVNWNSYTQKIKLFMSKIKKRGLVI